MPPSLHAWDRFTKDSATVQFLVTCLADMDVQQRREFLQFCTGCPHLPPGGVRHLHPPLKVILKDTRRPDVALPSARTCFHQIQLPAYSSLEVLRERLLFAVSNSKGLIDFT